MSQQRIEELLSELNKEISAFCKDGGCIEIEHYSNEGMRLLRPLRYRLSKNRAEFHQYSYKPMSFK